MEKRIKVFWVKFMRHAVFLVLVRRILERYNNIDVAVTLKRLSSTDIDDEFEGTIVYIPDKPRLFPLTGMERMPGLVRNIKKYNPDIIISNLYYTLYSLRSYLFAKKNNIPFILTTEEKDNSGLFRKILFPIWDSVFGREMLSYARYILAWSKDSKSFMENLVEDKAKVKLFLAGVDTSIFRPKQRNYRPNGKIRILMVARLVPYKEHATLLLALKKIKEETSLNFSLNLLSKGNQDLKKEIVKKIKSYGLENRVSFLEKVDHSSMVDLYNSHDLLVLPSRGEAIGMAVPEAMACGTCVIVSDTSGSKDYVEDGSNGLLFITGNYKDLAEKIVEMSEMDLEEVGRNAADHIQKNYDINKTADKLYSIIASANKFQ